VFCLFDHFPDYRGVDFGLTQFFDKKLSFLRRQRD
jgi:hypothetical protein